MKQILPEYKYRSRKAIVIYPTSTCISAQYSALITKLFIHQHKLLKCDRLKGKAQQENVLN